MNNLIFLDTETTGKGPDDRLIQLAYKPVNGKMVNQLFKPPVPINFEAMAVHHITEKDVAECSPFIGSQEEDDFKTFLVDGIVVAHNAPFDISMLEREGLKIPKFIDTLKVCQYLFDEPSYKLQYLRYKYGLNVDGKAHDAEGDVLVLEALFNEICDRNENGDLDWWINRMMEISQQPVLLRRISFGKHRGTDFKSLPRDYMEWLRRQSDLDADLIYTLDYYLHGQKEAV